MENKFTYIESDGVQVAVSVEANDSSEHEIYYPSNSLCYVKTGILNLNIEGQKYLISAGEFALIRKHTVSTCSKSWSKEEGGAIIYAFLMQDDFIQEIIRELAPPVKIAKEPINRLIPLQKNAILQGFFQSIDSYLESGKIDKTLLRLKTKEALLGIIKDEPQHIAVFSSFAAPERADLADFMKHNYIYNIPLRIAARMSGRSLSTFNREFKRIFNETPHRWMMRKRLEKAHELLRSTSQTPSQIYLTVGFEDLAHFSRSFKKEFGYSPTRIPEQAG